jgi:hypothetical protein
MRKLTQAEYQAAFGMSDEKLQPRQKEALAHALEIRRFEIELYWKRATYFWTFIAAAFAAYGIIQSNSDLTQKRHLSVLVSVLGFVFSFAWQAVNRGSKKWQENWENHVALLEDEVIGPLYKTIITRPSPEGLPQRIKHYLTGPSSYSVSKINQIISLFVLGVWLLLAVNSLLPISRSPDWFLITVVGLGIAACLAIRKYGRTEEEGHVLKVEQQDSKISE